MLSLAISLAGGSAQAANIAYINNSGGDVDYLNSYGNTVTYFNNPIGLTLAALAGYDALLITSNSAFSEPIVIGDVAADFADAGGGVVLTEFSFQGVWALAGRIMTAGYSPFSVDPSSSGYVIGSTLGTIYDPGSPMFTGVTTINVDTIFQADVGMTSGAVLVADWTSGRHALGYNSLSSSRVVGLNLFPDAIWSDDVDTQTLVANAIAFSLTSDDHPTAVPEPGSVTLWTLLGLAGFVARGARKRKPVA